MSQKIICVPRVGSVRLHVSVTFSTGRLILESGKSGAVAGKHPCIAGQLAAVGGDVERIIDARVYLLRASRS